MATSGEVCGDRVEGTGPQVAGVGQHVVLVHEGEGAARGARRPAECVANDSLDAESRVEALFRGHLVRSSAAKDATRTDVGTLSSLADDDHVDVGRRLSRERGGDARIQLDRSQVDVVVQLEPQTQEQAALEDTARNRRIADSTEQDRVVPPDLLEHRVGQRLAGSGANAGHRGRRWCART